MLRWDRLGETRVAFDAASDAALGHACAVIDTCTLPLIVHDYQRAAVLGTATLMMAGRRPLLLTASHLFDGGVRVGNLLLPQALGHGLIALGGARLTRSRSVDIAVLDISEVDGVEGLLQGRQAAAALLWPSMVENAQQPRPRRARNAHEQWRRVLVSGYPAALTRFERGWLAARRFTVLTRRHDEAAALRCRADRLFGYGRVASRADGVAVHTPELEGMSGAGMWVLEPGRAGQGARLRLDAVQSAYVHSRYMRGHDVGAALELFRH